MFTRVHVSVLMPVRNALPYLRHALQSLAAQQSTEFEVVAVDDGSTDGSGDELARAARHYPWLRVLSHSKSGVARSLNRAFRESRGALIARMDADDIAVPERLSVQSDFLSEHSTVGVCGSWFWIIGSRFGRPVRTPTSDAEIRARLVFGSPFAHPSTMMRREVLEKTPGPYDPQDEGMEDYGLWLRLAEFTRLQNIPRILLHYRVHAAQVTTRPNASRRARLEQFRRSFLERNGMSLNDVEARAHDATSFEPPIRPVPASDDVHRWLLRLENEFPRSRWCEQRHLAPECSDAWWRFLRQHQPGIRGARLYGRSPFARRGGHVVARVLRLALLR